MESNQHELYEYARNRIKQKKQLYLHFVVFVLGSIFLFVANKWLAFYPDTNWWTWAITAWLFLLILHTIKVFITDSFMNKNWERTQIDRLIELQSKKIEKLNSEIEKTTSSSE